MPSARSPLPWIVALSIAVGSCSPPRPACSADSDCPSGMRCKEGRCEARVCNGFVAWEPDVRPVLATRCGNCHTDPPRSVVAGGAAPPAGFRLDRYEDTGSTLGAKSKIERIVARMTQESMPPAPLSRLSESERALIDLWACLGAPFYRDAGPVDAGANDGGCEDVAWVPDIEPLLVGNCARCHTHPPKNELIDAGPYAGAVPSHVFRLDRYEDTVEPDGGMVAGAASVASSVRERTSSATAPMPPPDLPRLSPAEQKRLADWVCNGARRLRRSACDAGSAADGGC